MQEIDLSLSLDESSMICVVLCPIGSISEDKFAEYAETISRFGVVELNQLSRGAEKYDLTPHQDWKNGNVQFSFLKAKAAQIHDKDQFRHDFEELQWHKKITGVIGLVNAQDSQDLNDDFAYFKASMMTAFPTAAVYRCFAFDPRADQPDIDGGSEFVMIPQADPAHLHFYMSTLMADFATGILEYFQTFLGRVVCKPYVVTPLDDLNEERTIRKRQVGRMNKIKGDVCLQAGSPQDALEYYNKAISECRSYSDWVWLGSAYEGYCSVHLKLHGESQADITIVETFEEIFMCFSKSKSVKLELEACVKLAQHHCAMDRRTHANDLLMRCFALKNSLSEQSNVMLMSVMAQLYYAMGMYRKFAFCMQQLAVIYRKLQMNATTEKVLLMSARFYQLHEMAPGPGKVLTRRGKDVADRHGWLIVQAYMLMELANSAILRKDTFAYAQYVTYLLRSLSSTVSAKTQEELSRVLLKVTGNLSTAISVNMIGIPCVKRLWVHSAVDLVPVSSANTSEADSSSPSIFLYHPKMTKSQNTSAEIPLPPASLWIQGEVSNVSVELENTLDFPINVQSIQFVTRGSVKCQSFSAHITLQPHTLQTIVLSGVPLNIGSFVITGVLIRTFNLVCFHPVDFRGNGISEEHAELIDYDEIGELGDTVVKVAPITPQLQVESILFDGANLNLVEGSLQKIPLIVRNCSPLAIDYIEFHVEETSPIAGHHADVLKAFTWRSDNPSMLLGTPLLPSENFVLDLSVYGLPGATAAKFVFQYGSRNHPYQRLLELVIDINVEKGLSVVGLDVIVCDFAADQLPAPLTMNNRSSQEKEFCLVSIQVKNFASNSFSLYPELRDGTFIDPILCAPNFTTCFAFFMERKHIGDDQLERIPIDEAKQYIRVRPDDLLSDEAQMANKLIYNFKWNLQKFAKLRWTSTSHEKGSLSLSDLPVSFDHVKRMMPSPILIDISVSGVDVDETQPFSSHVTVKMGQFLDIDVTVINQTASVLFEKVFALNLDDELLAEHGESVVWAGSLDYLATSVKPGESVDQTFRVLFLAEGVYRFRAKCVNDKELTEYSLSPVLIVSVRD